MKPNNRISAEDLLKPIPARCGACHSQGMIYPDLEQGAMFCPNCSPAWLESFLRFGMNALRAAHGLEAL